MPRTPSPATELIRLGFADARRSARLLEDPALAAALTAAEVGGAPLPAALGHTADPDAALLLLVRLLDASGAGAAGRSAGGAAREIVDVLRTDSAHRRRLLAVLGASTALGDHLVARPELVAELAEDPDAPDVLALTPDDERRLALAAVGAEPAEQGGTARGEAPDPPVATLHGAAGADAVRAGYLRRLLRIAAADLTAAEPLAVFPEVAAALADIAGGAFEAALAVARADAAAEGLEGGDVRLAILGMGKTGGRELNYVSDVDVLYVVAPRDEAMSEEVTLAAGTWLAQRAARIIAGTEGDEPALWTVDANLRPEGKDGPLVRTIDSYRSYYRRWAQNWEFQALLKARTVAGDDALGAEFMALTAPFVWDAAGQENFVTDAQAMRRRVESLLPAKEADRELKLGRGGLRDVEFTVQLLQLVHGRADEAIRARGTLSGLAALADGGYVARDDAVVLGERYRFLRALEHRVQLHRLRRTHLLPTAERDLRRLARALAGTRSIRVEREEGKDGHGRFHAVPGEPLLDGTAESMTAAWRSARREVRRLHEEIFYRPLLPLTAQLSRDDISLSAEAARARLAAIGYRAPERALQQIKALTEGVSRRALIQKQILPVMLGWFAEGPDPDGGLLGFRTLSDRLGTTHWYLKLLRDSGTAGRALTHALSHSAYVAREIAEIPDAVQWLDDDADLLPRDPEALRAEIVSIVSRRETATEAIQAVRYLRRRELLRAALGDVLQSVDPQRARTMLAPVGDLALEGALAIARREVLTEAGRSEDEPLADFLLVAVGRTGGREPGYASDADVLFVHERVDDAAADDAVAEHALAVATRVRSLLSETMDEPAFPVDADLRPEGRQGPLIRSLESYREYYGRWAQAWERQALLRARPAAGDARLAEKFMRLVEPLRYPPGGFPAGDLREIRRIKARVEAERMPRGVDPKRHLKLGRGSLSDVEWTAQLLQARHAGDVQALRVTGTIDALRAARESGLLEPGDADVLTEAWLLATRVRAAIVLATGRLSGAKLDQLPHDPQELETVARLLGYPPGARLDLEEDYLRATRRCRAVMERVFYG